jgi:hypothetical protein
MHRRRPHAAAAVLRSGLSSSLSNLGLRQRRGSLACSFLFGDPSLSRQSYIATVFHL